MKSDKLLLSWSTIKSNLSHDGVACAGCKSVRIPPYRISATALNKAEEDAGERFYALQLFTLGCCGSPASTPFPSFAAATSNALAGDYKGGYSSVLCSPHTPSIAKQPFRVTTGSPRKNKKSGHWALICTKMLFKGQIYISELPSLKNHNQNHPSLHCKAAFFSTTCIVHLQATKSRRLILEIWKKDTHATTLLGLSSF